MVPRGTSVREGQHHASSPLSLQYLIDAIAELQLGSAARVRALVAVGALIIGVVLLVISGVVWSGLVKPPIQFTPAFANVGWTIMPTGGLLFCAGGLRAMDAIPKGSPLGPLAFLLAVAGVILSFWDPRWWGPRWYREQRWP